MSSSCWSRLSGPTGDSTPRTDSLSQEPSINNVVIQRSAVKLSKKSSNSYTLFPCKIQNLRNVHRFNGSFLKHLSLFMDNSQDVHKFENYFNWTMTYRLDSTFPIPYGHFIQVRTQCIIHVSKTSCLSTEKSTSCCQRSWGLHPAVWAWQFSAGHQVPVQRTRPRIHIQLQELQRQGGGHQGAQKVSIRK